jgi:hypothetical protein
LIVIFFYKYIKPPAKATVIDMSQVPTQTTLALKNAEIDKAIVELKLSISEGKTDTSSIIRRIYFTTALIKGMSSRDHTVEDLRAKHTQIVGKGKFDEEMFNPNIIFLANCVIDGETDREMIRAKITRQ